MATEKPDRETVEAFVQSQIRRGKRVTAPSRLADYIERTPSQWIEVHAWIAQSGYGTELLPLPNASSVEETASFWTDEKRALWADANAHWTKCDTLDLDDYEDVRAFLTDYPRHLETCKLTTTS